jgi:hypothetical protein
LKEKQENLFNALIEFVELKEEKSSPELTSRKRKKGEERSSGPVIDYVARATWLSSVIDLV